MADLLLELFSEEIPARMQVAAAKQLEETITKKLSEAGLKFDAAQSFSTPRRLTLHLTGLPLEQPDVREEKKGPRVGAPEKAVGGFLRSAGLESLEQCETRSDKKGEFYVAVIERKGGKTADVIAEMIPGVIRGFHWPKSMRWGAGTLRWVRPLHSILCTLDGKVVPFDVDHISSGDQTFGHRFHAPEPVRARTFKEYEKALAKGHVVLDREERKQIVWTDAVKLTASENVTVQHDQGLLEEVAGLIEWPVVLMGNFDEAFLEVPREVLISAMRSHQKYFGVADNSTGDITNRFVFVANLEAQDRGKAIVAGNERVLNARLSDAKFFWDQDRKVTLESRVEKLKDIVFYDKLGTVYDKVQRIDLFAQFLSSHVGASRADAGRAALLSKADLVTGMVFEFPELQGIMGRYYALEEAEGSVVADAIRDHYSPKGAGDDCPAESVSIALSLADRMDTLAAFWAIDQKPSGSKDPFALRRAALGAVRIILENGLRLELMKHLYFADLGARRDIELQELLRLRSLPISEFKKYRDEYKQWRRKYLDRTNEIKSVTGQFPPKSRQREFADVTVTVTDETLDLLSFFADRLKVYLRDKGARHDLIDAVFALRDADGNPPDDLVLIVARVEALGEFLDTEDGQNLLAGYKRAANILRIEEKKEKVKFSGTADESLLTEDAEKALFEAIAQADTVVRGHLEREDFTGAMAAVAKLRKPVDKFFDQVKVNDDDPQIRENRLKLLSQIRTSLEGVADFSKIEG